MNNPIQSDLKATPRRGTRLLDAIRAARASVGDGLNDDELTSLLRQTVLPTEAGFGFLSFSKGFVTLSVPEQDLAEWHPKQGWIMPEKEGIAQAIADKYRLSLVEPPDEVSNYRFPHCEVAIPHHHLELINHRETVIIAHPRYLKVRMFGVTGEGRFFRESKTPLDLGEDLLKDLSALYQV